MPATPDQITQARKLLKLTIRQLSENAGIGPKTLLRLEAGRPTQALTRVALRQALERAGVEFSFDGSVQIRAAAIRSIARRRITAPA